MFTKLALTMVIGLAALSAQAVNRNSNLSACDRKMISMALKDPRVIKHQQGHPISLERFSKPFLQNGQYGMTFQGFQGDIYSAYFTMTNYDEELCQVRLRQLIISSTGGMGTGGAYSGD